MDIIKKYKEEITAEYKQLNKTEQEATREDYERILGMIEQIQSIPNPTNAMIESARHMIAMEQIINAYSDLGRFLTNTSGYNHTSEVSYNNLKLPDPLD